MANKELLKFHKMTQKEYDRLPFDIRREKIQNFVSTTNKQKREAAIKNIAKRVEDARFDYANPDKVKQRKTLKKAGYLK